MRTLQCGLLQGGGGGGEGRPDPPLNFSFVQLTVLSWEDDSSAVGVWYCKEEEKEGEEGRPLIDFSFVQLTILSRGDKCRHSRVVYCKEEEEEEEGKVDPLLDTKRK